MASVLSVYDIKAENESGDAAEVQIEFTGGMLCTLPLRVTAPGPVRWEAEFVTLTNEIPSTPASQGLSGKLSLLLKHKPSGSSLTHTYMWLAVTLNHTPVFFVPDLRQPKNSLSQRLKFNGTRLHSLVIHVDFDVPTCRLAERVR